MHRVLTLFCAFAFAASLAPASALAAGDAAAGKEKFTMFCATCHGDSGKGDGPGAQGLQPTPRDFTKGEFKFDSNKNGKPGEDADLHGVVAKGAAEFGGSPLMVAWGGTLSDADIDNIIAYIRSFKK